MTHFTTLARLSGPVSHRALWPGRNCIAGNSRCRWHGRGGGPQNLGDRYRQQCINTDLREQHGYAYGHPRSTSRTAKAVCFWGAAWYPLTLPGLQRGSGRLTGNPGVTAQLGSVRGRSSAVGIGDDALPENCFSQSSAHSDPLLRDVPAAQTESGRAGMAGEVDGNGALLAR